MEQFEILIRELSESRELPDLRIDEEGCAEYPLICGLGMLMSFLDADRKIVLYCELGEPLSDGAVFHRKLLEAMHLWSANGGVTFGLVPESDIVSASLLVPYTDTLGLQDLTRAIDHFDEVVGAWLNELGEAEPDPIGDALDADEKNNSAPSMMRV